ncbi:MAG: methyltransferase RsmF C-terminal domain-like protein [Flavobacteriales bacterium]
MEKKARIIASLDHLLNDQQQKLLADALQETPSVSIRIHPLKKFLPGNEKQVSWCSLGFYLSERPVFTRDPLFHAGCYYPQEASSMFLHHVLSEILPENPVRILDLCAAPGGKTTLAATLLRENDLLIANEIERPRCSVLRENVLKYGDPRVYVTNNAPENFSTLEGFFDIIIVDAPCSGEGMIRKDPRALEEWSETNVRTCTIRQHDILQKIWPALKEGGVLVYSTCTYNTEENEKQIENWISDHSAENIELNVPDEWNITKTKAGHVSCYRFFPHKTRGEGFFLSALRKTETCNDHYIRKKDVVSPTREKEIADWVLPQWQKFLIRNGDAIVLQTHSTEIVRLKKHLRFALESYPVAVKKGKDIIPQPEFAMSIALNPDAFQSLELEQDEALRFLKTEDISTQGKSGWNLITYKQTPLGWIKQLQQRSNNYFPKEWKIRMEL